jgi:hypothetical protein
MLQLIWQLAYKAALSFRLQDVGEIVPIIVTAAHSRRGPPFQ